MGSFSFETMGTNTYLVYEIDEDEQVDSMSLGMLTHNNIIGFAPTSFTQVDTKRYIKYKISSKISVKQLFDGVVNKKRLLSVLSGVLGAMMAAEEYMIDINSLMLDTEYMFVDVSTCETIMVCLPVEKERGTDISMFFKNLIFSTCFDQTENCDHVAEIINYLNHDRALSVAKFKELVDGLNKNGVEKAREEKPKVAAVQSPIPQTNYAQRPVAPAQKVAPEPMRAVENRNNNQFAAPAPQYFQATGNVPVQAPPASFPPVSSPQQAVSNNQEKKMSKMYLLRHYTKENAAIYKAQKDAKEPAAPVEKKGGKKESKKESGKAKKNAAQPVGGMGFAIPGQEIPFSVPAGMSQPQPMRPAQPQQPIQPQPMRPAQPQQPIQPQPMRPAQPQQPIQPQPMRPAQPQQPVQPQPMRPAQPQQPVWQPAQQLVQSPAQKSYAGPSNVNFGQTTLLSEVKIGETTVLSAVSVDRQRQPYLVRMKTGEKIPVNKPVFRVGKERSYVDCFIGDNTAVSRSHANIITKDGAYFVMDTNSTNHTYVNGAMIQSNMEVPVEDGTVIAFANEQFEFKII